MKKILKALSYFFRSLVGALTPEERAEKGKKYVYESLENANIMYGTDDAVCLMVLAMVKECKTKSASLFDTDRQFAVGMAMAIDEIREKIDKNEPLI